MGGTPSPPPENPPPTNPYQPKLTKAVNSVQFLCNITNNNASVQVFGPKLLKELNMPKSGRLQRVEASWIEATTGGGPARIDYGETWVDCYLSRNGQPSMKFFSDYLQNVDDLSWVGDFDFDELDAIVVFTANVNSVSTFNINIIITYVMEVLQ